MMLENKNLSCLFKEYGVTAVLLLLSCVVYFYPYLVNHNYISAATHSDDDFRICNIVLTNIAYFKNDLFYYLVPVFQRGTLLNWGAEFLVNVLGIPVILITLSLQAFEFFMLPFTYVFMLRQTLDRIWLPFVFLAGLLSQHFFWNLSNHGMMDLPYRGNIATIILFIGMLLICNGKKYGYIITVAGILCQVAVGTYAFTIIAFWQLLHYRKFISRNTLFLLALFLTLFIPVCSILSLEHSVVAKNALLDCYRFSMHFYPWNSPYRWNEGFPTVISLFLMTILSYPSWISLGKAYRDMIIAAIFSSIVLSISHLAGIQFGIPSLMSLCGLHSWTLLAVIMLPVFLTYFTDLLVKGDMLERVLAAFVLIIMVIGRPYGLFLFPACILLFYVLRKKNHNGSGCRVLNVFCVFTTILWFIGWFVLPFSPCLYAARLFIDYTHPFTATFLIPILADKAPAVSKFPDLVPVLGISLLGIFLVLQRLHMKPGTVFPYLLAGIAFVFLVTVSLKTLERTGSQSAKDLYTAQIWAKNHTDKSDMFIVYGAAWRCFSERPAFVPAPLRFYLYLPDKRIKAFDDFVFSFYGISEPYRNYSQKSLQYAVDTAYHSMSEYDFVRMAEAVKAKYLVETRPLRLPLAYKNSTYYIYNVSNLKGF